MRRKTVAVLFCLVIALMAPAAWAGAQSVAIEPVTPTVMSGPDVGFRVEGIRGDTAVGRFVVRVNGRWVEAEEVHPLAIPRNR